MTEAERYDAVVIGSGEGGKYLAWDMAQAGQKLAVMERRWIGIDVTHLAIGLVKRRLIDAFPTAQFDIVGVPKDLGAAEALAEADKHQFQLWAL